MKISFSLFVCLCLTSCRFGQNESSERIIKDFHFAKWDENTWISNSKSGDSIFEAEKIIVGHNVFAVGNNEDFIIAKQHPCDNKEPHFMDFDSLAPNKRITNYLIIDTRNDANKLYRFTSEKDFNDRKIELGIPQSLPYKFYDKRLE